MQQDCYNSSVEIKMFDMSSNEDPSEENYVSFDKRERPTTNKNIPLDGGVAFQGMPK